MNHDAFKVRTDVFRVNVRMRGAGTPKPELKPFRKALCTFHDLEIMAVNIYRFQTTAEKTEHNRLLIAALLNEMTHVQDFQVKLSEYGFRPSMFRWAYWILGMTLGLVSRMLGRKVVLKTGIWVEQKAVRHYGELLESVGWDAETRQVLEKDREDEMEHVRMWEDLLKPESNRRE